MSWSTIPNSISTAPRLPPPKASVEPRRPGPIPISPPRSVDKRATGGGPTAEGVAWSVSVRQTFEWPGRIPLRKAIANQQIQLAELGFAQFKAALAARTRSLAFRLVRCAAESSGGQGSRRPLSCFARSAGATGPGRNHAGVGTYASSKRRRSRCSARRVRHQSRSRQRCSN